MFGILQQFDWVRSCEAEQKRRRPADLRGASECVQCGLCCWRKTCEVGPKDLAPIAAHLGVTEAEVFKTYLVVDSAPAGFTGFLLRPRLMNQQAGSYLTAKETFDTGQCSLMDAEGKCSIHKVKPGSARAYACWEGTGKSPFRSVWQKEAVMALGWDGLTND